MERAPELHAVASGSHSGRWVVVNETHGLPSWVLGGWALGRRAPEGPPARLELLLLCYLGGNWELGRGSARLAVGGLAVKPITAQLMSTPTEP